LLLGFFKKDVVLYEKAGIKMRGCEVKKTLNYMSTILDCILSVVY